MAKNRQSAALSLSESQLQVFISGLLGDGCVHTTSSNSTLYITNCKYEEYIDYKSKLLGDMFKAKIRQAENGYAKTPIYIMRSCSSQVLKDIKEWSIPELLEHITELGIALWFYDDGSLHKKNLFYNLNTHSFSKEVQEQYFIPFFNKLGIYPKLQVERKKDGRVFWYLRIGKFSGAAEVARILEKYPIECYSYKRWSSETIQKWSKFQEKLKSMDIDHNSLPLQTKIKLLRES
jgi:hypothetical protein